MPRRLTGTSRLSLTEDIANRFLYHRPEGEHLSRHEAVRQRMHAFTEVLASMLPESRERSLFLTKMEEASFWAHASIARIEQIPALNGDDHGSG